MVSETLYTYPDVVVVCDGLKFRMASRIQSRILF